MHPPIRYQSNYGVPTVINDDDPIDVAVAYSGDSVVVAHAVGAKYNVAVTYIIVTNTVAHAHDARLMHMLFPALLFLMLLLVSLQMLLLMIMLRIRLLPLTLTCSYHCSYPC
jgi:hypothetical protein